MSATTARVTNTNHPMRGCPVAAPVDAARACVYTLVRRSLAAFTRFVCADAFCVSVMLGREFFFELFDLLCLGRKPYPKIL
jgi:hypothetical protein